jgi:mRNA interferase MazF
MFISGLTASSVVRIKLFTLDNRFIIRKIGRLSDNDQQAVKQRLLQLFDHIDFHR